MAHKAQVGESFKYIFGIIIGSMFLIFFIGFAYKYMTSAEQIGDAELAIAIDNDLTAFSVSQSATNTIDYSREMDLTMFEGTLTPVGLPRGKDLDKIIYSPLELQGEALYSATKTVYFPYKITNFFYLSDKRTYYIVVYNGINEENKNLAEELEEGYSSIPNNFDFVVYDQDTLKDNIGQLNSLTANHDWVRFIFLTNQEITPNLDNYDTIIVEDFSEDEEFEFGTVTFEDGTTIYLSKEMLIGAIIAEDRAAYDFNLDLTLEQLESITDLYYEKAKFVSTRLPECNYAGIKTSLNNYKSFISGKTAQSITTQDLQSFKSYIDSIETANKNLGGDCPEVF